MRALELKERAELKRHGWVSHAIEQAYVDIPVMDGGQLRFSTYSSIHSHGLGETYGHLDFEVVIPIAPPSAHAILAALVSMVKEGRRFAPGELVDGVIRNYPVLLAAARESERPILRVVFPDKHGRFPYDPECDPGYAVQTTI